VMHLLSEPENRDHANYHQFDFYDRLYKPAHASFHLSLCYVLKL
jgi:hypothetical protein